MNLFDFGDADGIGTEARLQHPLGIVWDEVAGNLIIADTYNSKLKRIDSSGGTTTYLGGEQGWADGTNPRFYEPGGLTLSGRTLYVADTNNHVIRTVDLQTDAVSTLVLHGIERFSPPPDAAAYPGVIVEMPARTLAEGDGTIRLAIELPEGYKINEDAPSSVTFSVSGVEVAFAEGSEQSLTGAKLPIDLTATFARGSGVINADVTLLYCREDSEGLCIIEQILFSQPVTVAGDGDSEIVLPHSVELPNF